MATVTYRFQEIKCSRSIRLRCVECGKLRRRSLTIVHTVNPSNKNEDGTVRTPQEVAACVLKEIYQAIESVKGKGIVCGPCQAKTQ